MLDAFLTGAMAAREHHPFPDAALTLVGVHSLFEPDHLVEIEAVAVVDDPPDRGSRRQVPGRSTSPRQPPVSVPRCLDELLEAVEVGLGLALDDAELVADLLDDAVRVELELQHHLGGGVVEVVEGHHAGVVGPVGGAPRHPLVGELLGDLGVPLPAHAADVGHPVQVGVVELLTDSTPAMNRGNSSNCVHWS